MSTYERVLRNVGAIICLGYIVILVLAMALISSDQQIVLPVLAMYWTLFSLFLAFTTACARFVINDPIPGMMIRPRNPSEIKRVVVDGHTGEEVVISGESETTFREAARADWAFSSIKREDDWIIEDRYRNNISSSPLQSYDATAYIVPKKPRSARERTTAPADREKRDEDERYSTIDDGVKFYE